MNSTAVLRYGFGWDRDWALDFVMTFYPFVTVFNSIVYYPYMLFLLLRRSRHMQIDIRMGYIITVASDFEQIGLIFHDWIFGFCARPFILAPLPAFYCEGIVCTSGLSKQTIMGILAFAIVLPIPGFFWLIFRMYNIVVEGRKWKYMRSIRIVGMIYQISCMVANVIGFAMFGKDSDNFNELSQEPEYEMFLRRNGTLMIFGSAGAPQYLKYEMIILAVTIATTAPPLIAMMAHAMIVLDEKEGLAKSERSLQLTRSLFRTISFQLSGAFFYVVLPHFATSFLSFVDTREALPDIIHFALRLTIITLLTMDPGQFCAVFIWRNLSHGMFIPIVFSRYFMKRTVTPASPIANTNL